MSKSLNKNLKKSAIGLGLFFGFTLSLPATEPAASWNLENFQNLRTEGEVSLVDGVAGKAVSLNGSASLEANAPPTPGKQVTLECWVKLDTLEQEWRGVLSRSGKGGLGYGILFRSAGNGFRFVVTLDAKTVAMVQTEKETIVPGQWYHLAGVYDGKAVTLFLNGMPFTRNASVDLPEVDAPIYIGKMGSWTKDGLKGAIGAPAIYAAALSGSEISAHIARYVKSGGVVNYVACDFEDVGTWRSIFSSGTKGMWFAGHIFLSSSKKEKQNGDYVGVVRYAFTEPAGPYRFSFRRAKIMENKVQSLKSISFLANPKDYPCEIGFEILDGKGRKVTTDSVPLTKNTWKQYTIPFDESHARGSSALEGPFCIHTLNFIGKEAGEGEMFVDDLTLTGEVLDPKKRVSVSSIYKTLAYKPGEPVELDYRIRNASSKDETITLSLDVEDFLGKQIATQKTSVSIKANAEGATRFTFPKMDIGHYRVKIAVSGGVSYQIEDMFGVFIPNGKRVNRMPMFFGSQDQGMWKGEEENILHKEWMHALGVDLERAGITGSRFEYERGNTKSSDGFTFELKELAKHDIDVFICYLNVPEYNTRGSGTPPKDYDLFQEHAEHIGTYLSQFPNVKYVEFWNEPDVEAFHGTTEDYLAALKSFYTGIKKTAPQIRVTTGGMTVKHPREKKDFTRDVYIKGKGFYDIAAFHAHGPVENYMELNDTVEGYLKQAGNPVPICNTEAGDRSAYDYGGYRSQAATLVKKITYAKTRSATEFYAWFTLKDYWDMDPNADDSFGLINTDNRVKPSFLAYNELIRQLANTRTGAPAPLDERLVAYQFVRDNGQTVYVVWPKTSGANVAFALSTKTPLIRTDMFGKNETLTPEGGKVFVSVAGYPIYLSTTGGALAAAKGDSSFFDCPSSVGAGPGEKVAFQAAVKNVWQKDASVGIKFFNDRSVEIGTYSFSLPKGAVKNIPLSLDIPAGETLGAKNYYFTFNAPENGVQNMFLPLSVVASYQTVQVPGGFSQDPGAALSKARARTILLDKADDIRELAFDALIPKWSGPADLSVKASAGHDGKSICFTFGVSDDKHVQTFDNADIWRGDSVQVAFYSADGKQNEFALALGPNGPVTWCHMSFDKKNIGKWDVPVRINRAEGHTLYEVVVPFEKLGVTLAKDKSLFRFAFLVNDDDGRGRVRFAQWFGGIGSGSKNPDLYGYGQFEIK